MLLTALILLDLLRYMPGYGRTRFRWGLARLAVVVLPLAVDSAICVSRVSDYYHTYSDILAGAVIGAGSAMLAWHMERATWRPLRWEWCGVVWCGVAIYACLLTAAVVSRQQTGGQ